jgi:acyl carrier protein
MTQSIEQIVITVIARHKNLDPASITPGAELAALGITSLDAIAIAYEIEEDLGIEIPNEEIEDLQTVRDLITGLQRLTVGQG